MDQLKQKNEKEAVMSSNCFGISAVFQNGWYFTSYPDGIEVVIFLKIPAFRFSRYLDSLTPCVILEQVGFLEVLWYILFGCGSGFVF